MPGFIGGRRMLLAHSKILLDTATLQNKVEDRLQLFLKCRTRC